MLRRAAGGRQAPLPRRRQPLAEQARRVGCQPGVVHAGERAARAPQRARRGRDLAAQPGQRLRARGAVRGHSRQEGEGGCVSMRASQLGAGGFTGISARIKAQPSCLL